MHGWVYWRCVKSVRSRTMHRIRDVHSPREVGVRWGTHMWRQLCFRNARSSWGRRGTFRPSDVLAKYPQESYSREKTFQQYVVKEGDNEQRFVLAYVKLILFLSSISYLWKPGPFFNAIQIDRKTGQLLLQRVDWTSEGEKATDESSMLQRQKYEHLVLILWWRAYVFEDMGRR